MSLSVHVCVMEECTGRTRWLQLPCDDVKSRLPGFDTSDLVISDSESVLYSVGDNVFLANAVIKDLNSLGVDDEDKVCALLLASGCDSLSDPEFVKVLDGDFSVLKIDAKWNLTDEETAACWLATEEYIPFGELDMGDLVTLEDKLMDFIDWRSVWEKYEDYGWELVDVDKELFLIQIRNSVV